ncbi:MULTISPECIES: hypothetical protein [Paraburkholderia]|nr:MULTISPECIES: hypothetical protein [Paraburkholderia]MCX4176644.1 hypothetical protein [Paraburkholderia madseniana]MDQ6464635.1 hypothetical protein [Paraburkholderia madseniana]
MNAEEWMLFADMPGAETAAEALSKAAADALMTAWELMTGGQILNPFQAQMYAIRKWGETANRYVDIGACDTEPRAEMQSLAWTFFMEPPEAALKLLRAGH